MTAAADNIICTDAYLKLMKSGAVDSPVEMVPKHLVDRSVLAEERRPMKDGIRLAVELSAGRWLAVYGLHRPGV